MRNSIRRMLVAGVVLLSTTAWIAPGDNPDVNALTDAQLLGRSQEQLQTEPPPEESAAGAASAEPTLESERSGDDEVEGIGPDLNTNLK
jgi:hypothetical protein